MGNYVTKLRFLINVLCGGVCGLYAMGCSPKGRAIDLGEGFEVVYVNDPDPEQDKNLPKQCNPSGKTGAALKGCLEYNERFYADFDKEAMEREPWYRFSHENWLSVAEVESTFVFPVTDIAGAIEKLEAVPIVELSPSDAASMTRKTASFRNKKPFLVRGIAIEPQKGQFSVYLKNDAMLVMHNSIGDSLKSETRVPIVVWLDKKPSHIYVDCQLAAE